MTLKWNIILQLAQNLTAVFFGKTDHRIEHHIKTWLWLVTDILSLTEQQLPAIASATLKDHGLITDDDKMLVIDRSKL